MPRTKVNKTKTGRPPQQVIPAHTYPAAYKLGWWRQILTDRERLAYARLRQASLDENRLGQTMMRQALGGCHPYSLIEVFQALERYGFIECKDWGKIMPREVIVNEVPSKPGRKQQAHYELEVMGKGRPGEVAEFMTWFANEWEAYRHNKGRYPVTPGKEHALARRLLALYSLKQLKHYAAFFMKYMEPPKTISSFAGRIEEVVRGYTQLQQELHARPDAGY